MLRLWVIALAIAAIWTGVNTAQAGSDGVDFPTRPIKIIVPFPAGGGTDLLTRLIAQRMSEDWNQPVIIENRPGANTAIGAEVAAHAAPDGYTLLAAMDVTMVMNSASGAPISYDPLKDFVPITLLAKNGMLLGVRSEGGPRTAQELIAKGKGTQQKLTYGAGAPITRLAGFLFTKGAGFDAVMVPYKGSAEALQGLLTGSVDFVLDGVATILPFVKSGQFRALAKLDGRPLPSLPDLPTLATAANLPQLEDMVAWTALVVPTGTPDAIVGKLHDEVVGIYSDQKIVDRLKELGVSAATSTPSELGDFNRRELVRWTKVYKDNNIDF